MKTTRARRPRRAVLFAVSAVGVAATFVGASARAAASPASSGASPIVRLLAASSAALTPRGCVPSWGCRTPPRRSAGCAGAPGPGGGLVGVRDATHFGPRCTQTLTGNPATAGPISEDCLYLNVYAPTAGRSERGGRPVMVWIHGGGLTGGARNNDRTSSGSRRRLRHDQLPPRRARLPRTRRSPRGGRRRRQLRPDGPAGGAALGPETSRSSAATRAT